MVNGDFCFYVWDVDHGFAAYLSTPNGKNIIFDLGQGSFEENSPYGEPFSPLLYIKSKYHVDSIDYLVLSHPHEDHIAELSNLKRLGLNPKYLQRPRGFTNEKLKGLVPNLPDDLRKLWVSYDESYCESSAADECPWLPENNGGILINSFLPNYSGANVNNYSTVCVVKYSNTKIIIPGDVETEGWNSLLANSQFLDAIRGANILVASHHGRESGYCDKLFEYFKPWYVIVSDSAKTKTDCSRKYYQHAIGEQVNGKERKVLSTRNDGRILFKICGSFDGRMYRNTRLL